MPPLLFPLTDVCVVSDVAVVEAATSAHTQGALVPSHFNAMGLKVFPDGQRHWTQENL